MAANSSKKRKADDDAAAGYVVCGRRQGRQPARREDSSRGVVGASRNDCISVFPETLYSKHGFDRVEGLTVEC